MAYTTVFENIVFIEGYHPEAKILAPIDLELWGIGAQLKNLRDVKAAMVRVAVQNNGNCVVDFTYGQRSRYLAFDDVAFWGKGKAALLPQATYREILEKKH